MVKDGLIPRELADLERTVQAKYPDLALVSDGGPPRLRGSFPVMHEGCAIDRFTIEIRFPSGISRLPAISEIGGRIPRHADRHVFRDGAICTEVPELTLLRGQFSLVDYLGGPVHNYFLGQLAVELGKPWPFGERPHNAEGLLEAYGELLGMTEESAIRLCLDYLGHAQIKGHWTCLCGSGNDLLPVSGPAFM